MKDWEDIIKERQTDRNAPLPESDWNDFLSRKASHDLAVKRRRRFITTAISVPAAAAVLLLLFLMPFRSNPQGAMDETAIQGVVAKVQAVSDTAKFNSAAYRLPEGESVEDLIRKLPGVQIDSAGNITVNGKSVNRILVNGKEFFNTDTTKSLTQLTAEMIEKVKAYEKNSDQSRQTGIDDGREETVLDLHPSKKELRKARRAERKRKRKDALLNDPFASK